MEHIEKTYNGKYLLRMSPQQHEKIAEAASLQGESMNEFILKSVENRMVMEMNSSTTFTRLNIGQVQVANLREAVIVTQHPWFMDLLKEYGVYFFNANLGEVKPMQYLLFYETTKVEQTGNHNEHPRHIASWGKVKEIIYNVKPDDIICIPEIAKITKDSTFWNEIKNWTLNHIVILEEVGKLKNPLRLENGIEAKYLVNKTTSFPRLRNATCVDDLYK